jgi:hypothetical protein
MTIFLPYFDVFMLILTKIILFLFWFSIGVYLQLSVSNSRFLKLKSILNFNFLKLFLISYAFILLYFIMSQMLENIITIHFGFLGLDDYSSSINMFTGDEGTSAGSSNSVSNSNSPANVAGKASDGAIMAISLSGGIKIAESSSTFAVKAGAVAISIVTGAVAIIATNISGNFSSNVGTNKFLSDLDLQLENLFNLSGDSVLDLLRMIQIFGFLQILLIIFIIYFYIMLKISNLKVEAFLLRLLPIKIANYILKGITLSQNTSKIFIGFCFLLLIINTLLGAYYLDFVIVNYENICQYIIENHNKK